MEFQTEMKKMSLAKRIEDSTRLLKKFYPKLPIIIDRHRTSDPSINKSKYLIDPEITIGNLLTIIRRRIQLNPNEAIYLFVNNEIVSVQSTILEVYQQSQLKNPDGFLYIVYCLENTFG